MIECKVEGCTKLTSNDNGLCLFHDTFYNVCKHLDYRGNTIPVPYCDLKEERISGGKWLCKDCKDFNNGLDIEKT